MPIIVYFVGIYLHVHNGTCEFVTSSLHAARARVVNRRNVSIVSYHTHTRIAIMVLAAPEAGYSSLVAKIIFFLRTLVYLGSRDKPTELCVKSAT